MHGRADNMRRLTEDYQANPGDVNVAGHLIKELLRQNVNDQALRVLQEVGKASGETARNEILENLSDMENFKMRMALDYLDSVNVLTEFGVLNEGETSYVSDYEETAGRRFEMPGMQEVLSWLTEKDLELYREMEKEGLEPKLQLTPVGLKIRTLAAKIDAHKTMPRQANTYVWNEINDSEIKYDPERYDASNRNELVTIGGISKKELIEKEKGWELRIVAMKQNLEADPEVMNDSKGREYTSAQKTAIYHDKFRKEGKSGLSYESYLVAQMRALRDKKPLEKEYWTILPDSSIDDPRRVSYGSWDSVQLRLFLGIASNQGNVMRCRSSVRVKRGA